MTSSLAGHRTARGRRARVVVIAAGLLAISAPLLPLPPRIAPPAHAPEPGATLARLPADLRPIALQAINQRGGLSFAIRPAGGSFEAANGAHGFGVVFDGEGVRISPAAARRAPLLLQLAGYGRRNAPGAISMGHWEASGQRIERRSESGDADLAEWYINGPLGLEQGFTISRPPAGHQELTLDLRVSGAWSVRADTDRQAMDLVEETTGTRLHYAGLFVTDATGRRLPAAMRATGEGVSIDVDASAAIYPITIDPFIQQQKLTTPAGADTFGISVAVDGDTVIVGAPGTDVSGRTNQGLAFVFVRIGTTWAQQSTLAPENPTDVREFGTSVALSGETALVGAQREAVEGRGSQGAAYVFVRSGSTWSQQQRLVAADGIAGAFFGGSVALDGNTAAIGAPTMTVGGRLGRGAAYIFGRAGTTWTQQQMLIADDGLANDNFGISVSLSGNTVLIGSFLDEVANNGDQGSAYVFTRANTTWTLQQKLIAADGLPADHFGLSVSVSGDRALVGVPQHDVNSASDQGAAYVFVRGGTTWAQEQKLTASDGRSIDRFGQNVAIDGGVLVVGAPIHDDGAAYVFRRAAGTWMQGEILTPSDRTSRFGVVALDDDTIAVGAPEFGRVLGPGSAYVFVDRVVTVPPGVATPPVLDAPVVTGSTVRVTWSASPGALRYQLRAGTAPGGSNAFNGDVGNTTALTAVGVPTGSYFVRVHAMNASGESGPSNEVRVDVGVAGPCVVPANPTNLAASVSGSLVTLTWTSVPGPTSYIVEAGSSSGAANLAVIDTGSVTPVLMASAPRGTYFVRVRARNGCGVSGPSNQVVVVVVN